MRCPRWTHPRQLCTELLGAGVSGEAREPAPERLDFRRSVESEQPAERRGVSFLQMLGPLDA
jgi:hypothetical protein